MEIARVLLASQKQGRWQQKQPKMLLTSPEMGRWQHFAEVRPGCRVSPKPCKAKGAGGCCGGGWAARGAYFGDPCKAACPTDPWNEGQPARFWREPAARHNKSEAHQRRGTAKGDFAEVAGLRRGSKVVRQNRAGRGALEGAVAGVALNGWPISGTRAGRYAPQAPGTRVSLHGFGENPPENC